MIGVGIDFTSCTMLPTLADGTPLCLLDELRREPHAWVKLWKHHAAQPEADRINAVAAERGERWLTRYGGKISSEWFFAKALQILDEAPEIYDRADRLIEAADWVVWQLTGVGDAQHLHRRLQGDLVEARRLPGGRVLRGARPAVRARRRREDVARASCRSASRAGGLSERAAAWTGLLPGTAVAVANVDAHVSVPAATVTEPGTMVAIMGTSICHMLLGDELATVDGMCGVVEDGIVPGLFGYEAGQSAVGDIFAWFVENAVPPEYHEAGPPPRHRTCTRCSRTEAAKLAPGRERACSRSTGGTATARCSSTRTSAACSSG